MLGENEKLENRTDLEKPRKIPKTDTDLEKRRKIPKTVYAYRKTVLPTFLKWVIPKKPSGFFGYYPLQKTH
jgi:hypothetical protein